MRYNNFEEMPMWKHARVLVRDVYKLCSENDKISRDFGLKDQIQRAALSIMNNIAEGFDAPTNKVYSRYLTYAVQSCSEVISITYVLEDVYAIAGHSAQLRKDAISLRKQIKGLKKFLLARPSKPQH